MKKTFLSRVYAYYAVCIALACVVYFVYSIQDKLSIQSTQIIALQSDVSEAKNSTDVKIAGLKGSIESIQKELEEKHRVPLTMDEVIKYWSPQVVFLACNMPDQGILSMKTTGSGFFTVYRDKKYYVMTNKHIITNDGLSMAKKCTVSFLDGQKYTVDTRSEYFPSAKYDFADLLVSGLSERTRSIANKNLKPYCGTRAEIGDKIVALGYPTIGSNEGLTVTEGIISGYDGDYYITSAKIDSGNSGGIAVSMDRNCIVGITSAAVTGGIESLGRILSSQVILR